MRRVASLVVLSLLLQSPIAPAQVATGNIYGTVTDESGAVLPGASVMLSGPSVRGRSVTSGKQGEFHFVNLHPGVYKLTVSLTGFSTLHREVVVRAGLSVTLQFALKVATVEETVTVTAETPMVDTRRVGTATTIVSDELGRVPSSRPGPKRQRSAPPQPTPLLPLQLTQSAPFVTEAYDRIDEEGFLSPAHHPYSTFSVDVDTASYANVRRFLELGALPPKDAVRIEEMINYFRYDYPPPQDEVPFSVTAGLAACPWNPQHALLRIGLQGKRLDAAKLPPRNLVFLIDVSGSMEQPNKLPLVQASLKLLADQLGERDRVAIVVYAGATGLVLPSTPGERKHEVLQAIDRLRAGGTTNGGAGIQLAYSVATDNFIRGGVNRVVLATDGDFNVGITDQGALLRLIEEKRETGVFLSVLGFGMGNLKDSTMEKLADRGNGNYAYIDTLREARKVLVQEAAGTLVTIAKDVKLQVEFNPTRVEGYRLVGYENRRLRDEDFKDDRKDAGDIGVGHSVTALYELVPRGRCAEVGSVDPPRYVAEPKLQSTALRDEIGTVKLRYKQPDGTTSRELEVRIADPGPALAGPSGDLAWAAAVAELGLLLRDSDHKGSASFEQVLELARPARGKDADGYRIEFIRLAELAQGLARVKLSEGRR